MEIKFDNVGDELIVIHKGIHTSLPCYNSLPQTSLTFAKHKGLTLETGTLYFSSLSKLNDLALKSTEEIASHMEGCVVVESDFNNLTQKIKKDFFESGTAKVISKNLAYPGKFFVSDTDAKKSSNFIVENNFYFARYDLVRFEVFSILYEYYDEDVIVIKFPTTAGETIIDVLRVYAYICGSLTLVKSKKDSWFKDSFIMVGEKINVTRLKEVRDTFANSVKHKQIKITDRFTNKFMIWPHKTVEKNFIEVWNNFTQSIRLANYGLFSLLLLSIEHNSKSLNNPIRVFMKHIVNGKLPRLLYERKCKYENNALTEKDEKREFIPIPQELEKIYY
ncbi:mRNA capping enzyme small subunit [Carp edema virus]|nr:mRNA capping enzyme small subunit [Carp edema virus]